MTKYREILRLSALGLTLREIAASLQVSQHTIIDVRRRAKELSLSWPLDESYTDAELQRVMFPKAPSSTSTKRMPDYDYIRKELLRNGVNKKLLWTEYLEDCKTAGDDPLMYSQFCYHIQQNEQKRNATMHLPRKPGEQIEVDWAGDPAEIIDPYTGEITKAWIFVGVMTYSQYAFVEAFINEKERAWITAHVHMYEFFGGVTPILVPDNAPTATNRKQSDKYEPVLIQSYQELAQHYNTAIIPARVRTPKDKPNAEGNVGHVSTWITAALRNEQFFSLTELNQEIRRKLKKYNEANFEKKEGSRLSLFLEEEKPLLAALPATRFELAEHRTATVQFNYHIAVDKMYYSVPYQYIKDKVDVRITDTTIEVFQGPPADRFPQASLRTFRAVFHRPRTYASGSPEISGMERRPFPQMGGNNRNQYIQGRRRPSYLRQGGTTVLQSLHGSFEARGEKESAEAGSCLCKGAAVLKFTQL